MLQIIFVQKAKVQFDLFLKAARSLIEETFKNWQKDSVSRLAASLAFYSSFSLAPALVIGLAVAGALVGDMVAQARLTEEIQNYLGPQATPFITDVIVKWRGHMTGSSATIIGIIGSLFGATAAFVELQAAFNIIWKSERNRRSFITQALYERVVAFVVVLGIGIFLLISLFLGTAVEVLNRYLVGWLPIPAGLFHWINLLVTLVLTTLLAAALFRLLPDRNLRWGDVWLGAAVTSILWAIGKYLIAMYFAHTAVSSLYGAAGSFAIILLWIYYNAHVLFFGAEIAHAYVEIFGSEESVSSRNAPSMSQSADMNEEIASDETKPESTPKRGPGEKDS